MCAKYVVLYKMWLLFGFIWLTVLGKCIFQVDGLPQKGDTVSRDDRDPRVITYFQGDMIIGKVSAMTGGTGVSSDAVVGPNKKWPKTSSVFLPYGPLDDFNKDEKNMIIRAFEEFEAHTCIRFIKLKAEHNNYVDIKKKDGCKSHVGRNQEAPEQLLYLWSDCFKQYGTILHELMHTIGFHHEHSRTDRDKYITIDDNNIEDGKDGNNKDNFAMIYSSPIQDLGLPYDFYSVMHYPAYIDNFAKNNNLPIISSKMSEVTSFGQRKNLSKLDVRGINLLYGCTTELNSKPAPTECKDAHILCPVWERNGECNDDTKLQYMNGFCKKSCKKCGCPAGTFSTTNSTTCFKYDKNDLSWTDAWQFCKNQGEGWKLATPNDDVNLEELSKYVKDLISGPNNHKGTRVWLGGRGSDANPKKFHWEKVVAERPYNRRPLDGNPGWSPSSSDASRGGDDRCVGLTPYEGSTPYMSTECFRTFPTLCQL